MSDKPRERTEQMDQAGQIARAEAELRRLTAGADEWNDVCERAACEYALLLLADGMDQSAAAERLTSAGSRTRERGN